MKNTQRGIAPIIIALIIAIIISGGASIYFLSTKTKTVPQQNQQQTQQQESNQQASTTTTAADDCALIATSHFRSVNNIIVGMGPNGAVMGKGYLDFQGNAFSGQTGGDVLISGTYTCAQNVLHIKNSNATATYDSDSKILLWDGVEYVRAP